MTDNLAPIVLARKESASVDAALKRMEAMRAATPASPSAPVATAAPAQPAAPASARGPTVGGVVRDVAQGAVETMTLNPQRNALLYGVASAVDEFFDTTLDLALYPFGKSHKDVDAILDPIAGTFSLEGPRSTTGKVVSSVAQFMSGMMAGSAALKGVGAAKKLGSFGTAVVAGGAADALVFDEQQARLSTLIQTVPALQNPVTEYLAGDPGDSIVELKFKQALEGLALGGLTEGLYQGVRAIKRGMSERAAARAETPEGQAATATAGAKAAPEESLVPELTDRDWMTLGGKPDAPLFEVTPASQERTASLIKMAEERWGPDSVPGLLAEVRKPTPAPQGLMSWLRSKGGLQESGGELGARGLVKRLPGLVNNKGGMALDDAALAATEAGYIGTPGGGRASIDDLLAALDRENAGTPVWSSADQVRVDRRETVDQFGRMLDELGIDINAPDAEIEAALRARGGGGANPVDGIEVFHGSPHVFDKFDMSKIGTGGGYATEGRGLYFTDSEAFAAQYKTDGGAIYKARINVDRSKVPDWDKPISALDDETKANLARKFPDLMGNEKTRLSGLYYRLAEKLDVDGAENGFAVDKARDAFVEAGIKVVRRGSAGENNYTVFDDSLVEAISRDGEPIGRQTIDEALADNPDLATSLPTRPSKDDLTINHVLWGDDKKMVSIPILHRGQDTGTPRLSIENGQVYVDGAFAENVRLMRYVDDFIQPLGDNVFVRSAQNPKDIEHVKNGTHKGSTNHATGVQEGGLSVARALEFPAKYQYFVTGDVIGQGTDGEPLLKLSSVKVLSNNMTLKKFNEEAEKRLTPQLEKIGITNKDYRSLISGGRIVKSLPKDIVSKPASAPAPSLGIGAERQIDETLADNPDMATVPRTAADIEAENAAGALDVSPDDMLGRIKIGNKVGNINLNRIGGTDDLRAVIRQTAEELDKQTPLATVRQGEGVAREMADRLLLDSDSMAKLLSGQSVRGQAFTREEIIATGELVTQTGKSIEKLARKVATGGASDTEKLALHRAVAFQGSVLNLVSGQAREAGRALQSFQTIVRGNKAAMVALRDATAQHGTTEALARALNSLPPQGQAAMARAAAQGGGLFHRGMEAVVEYWLAGLLWGPRTHAVNITSNALTAFGGPAERYVAGRIGSGVARDEGAAMLYGQLTSFREALRAAGHGFRTGQPLLDAGNKIDQVFKPKLSAAHLGVDENTILGRALDGLGEVQRMSFRALTGSDEFFKVMARNGEKHAQAYRIAASEGLDGDRMAARVVELVQAPTAEMQAAMNDYARYVTFQQAAGPTTVKLQQLVQTHPLLRIPLPFIQTPTNIFKYVGERTPLAVMSRKVRDEISAGGARRDLALAKISMGSMAMATAADYASQGLITGAPPGDPQLRQALERTGVLPYSVKAGDSWIQFNQLDPMGMTIGLAADYANIMRSWTEFEGLALPDADLAAVRQTMIERGGDPATVDEDLARLEQETGLDPMKVAAAVVVAVHENMLNKSYLQGLSDIFEILSAPSTAQSADSAKRWAQGMGASLLPVSGMLRQAESIVDPNLRYADTMMEAWRSMVPGLSSSLPVVPDLWGQPRQHINSSLVPIAIRDAKLSPVDSEIVRLKAEVSMPTKQIGEVRLKPDEYVRFVELAGRDIRDQATGLNAKQYLDAVVSGNAEATGEPDERSVVMPLGLPAVVSIAQMYKAGTDGPSGSKATIIKSIVSGFREAARAEMLRSDPGLAAVIEARKRIEAEKKAGAR